MLYTADSVAPGEGTTGRHGSVRQCNNVITGTADKVCTLLPSSPHAEGAEAHHLRSHREASMPQPSGRPPANIEGAQVPKAA